MRRFGALLGNGDLLAPRDSLAEIDGIQFSSLRVRIFARDSGGHVRLWQIVSCVGAAAKPSAPIRASCWQPLETRSYRPRRNKQQIVAPALDTLFRSVEESRRERFYLRGDRSMRRCINYTNTSAIQACSDGRVVKATVSKAVGLCPRKFESCSLRLNFFIHLAHLYDHVP